MFENDPRTVKFFEELDTIQSKYDEVLKLNGITDLRNEVGLIITVGQIDRLTWPTGMPEGLKPIVIKLYEDLHAHL